MYKDNIFYMDIIDLKRLTSSFCMDFIDLKRLKSSTQVNFQED